MKLSVVDVSGKEVGSISAKAAVFAQPINRALVTQAMYVYRMNRRQGSAQVLGRGDVYGSRRKLWRQKGTGRARHGDRFAPQFVGGGVAHGPTGQENWSRKMNEKMRRKALFSVLSQKQAQGRLTVINSVSSFKKTRAVARMVDHFGGGDGVLLVVKDVSDVLSRVTRNLKRVQLLPVHSLNALVVLETNRLIMTKDAVEMIQTIGT